MALFQVIKYNGPANVLEKAAQNLGSSGELAGVSVGMAMGNVMADMVRETIKTSTTVQPSPAPSRL